MLAVAGAVLAAASLAGGAPCTRTAAASAIAAAPVPRVVKELAADRSGGPNVLICRDLTRDGRTDMVVTLASGGTAGDLAWVAFVGTASGRRYAGFATGYKLGLVRAGSDLVETQPVYLDGDPNCCPTGGFEHRRLRWNGKRFAVIRRWHDDRFGP